MKLEGFSGYEIYPEEGRVWSYKSNKWIGSPDETTSGYWKVGLMGDDGKQYNFYLHRLIWQAVNGAIPEGLEVNHITEDKNLNGIQHLSLCSHKDNINFGTGIQRRARKQRNGKRSKQVGAFKNGVLVMTFPSINEARRQGYTASNISACCRNCYTRQGNNTYKGYQWKFLN